MIIIGVDFRPEFQQIAWADTGTGELQELRLRHREEAERFYRELGARAVPVRIGMEASGHGRWFERLLGELQFVDRGCGRDPNQAGTQAEDGSARCPTDFKAIAGRSFSANLGTELGESRSTATAVASASAGADADPGHESVAIRSLERGRALQKELVAGTGTAAIGNLPLSFGSQPTTARSAGVAGSTEPDQRGAQPSDPAGSGKVSRGRQSAANDTTHKGLPRNAGHIDPENRVDGFK